MGVYMKDDDLYIGALLEVLNLQFGKYRHDSPDPKDEYLNGVDEVRSLQQEFGVFKVGRPLVRSLRLLGVGGLWNIEVKRKWFRLLGWLDEVGSTNLPNTRGGDAIVKALITHLDKESPDPVYFKAHDLRKTPGPKVQIKYDQPLFYMEQRFLTISIPMQPKSSKDGGSKAGATSKRPTRPTRPKTR